MNVRPISDVTVISNTHAQFLEQLNDEEFWNYADEIARSVPATYDSVDEYLVCELGKGACLLPLSSLREIVPPPYRFTLLPAAPIWMPGIAAWRGETIAVIDLEAYLSNNQAFLRSDGMLLIAQLDALTFGLFVTAVGSIISLAPEHMHSPDQAPVWSVPPDARVARGMYCEKELKALVLDVSILSYDIMRRLRVIADYE